MRTRHGFTAISALLLTAMVLSTNPASAAPGPQSPAVDVLPTPADPGIVLEEAVGLTPEEIASVGDTPLVSPEMDDLADEITAAFTTDPRFSTAEITEAVDKIIVHWHGDVDPALEAMIDRHPAINVEFQQTRYLPGDLRDAADALILNDPSVTSVSVEYDGSGLEATVAPSIGLDPTASSTAGRPAPEPAQQSVEESTDFPIEVTIEAAALPAAGTDRGFDTYHLGGALISDYINGRTYSSCTAGFAVEKDGVSGMMFAAHCGPTGRQWIITDRQNNPGVAQAYGPTVLRNTQYDGAIISTTFSHPYIYVGGVRATTISVVSGSGYVNTGDRVCFSGAFTGTRCDSVVGNTYKRVSMTNQPDLQNVIVFETTSSDGNAAAGNGDSGGPVYKLRSDGTRTAVGIISSMPPTATAAACSTTGTPGSATRRCSATMYSTAVSSIAIATGWTVKVR